VLTGEIILRIQKGDTLIERPMSQGAAFHIAPQLIHQFEAVAPTDLLEASTPRSTTWCGSKTATEGVR